MGAFAPRPTSSDISDNGPMDLTTNFIRPRHQTQAIPARRPLSSTRNDSTRNNKQCILAQAP